MLYLSMRSLVGNFLTMEGFATCCTPLVYRHTACWYHVPTWPQICAGVCNILRLVCTITMTKKSDAPFALDRLFRYEGVPPELIMDGSKEQNLGDFARKLRDAGCHITQIEPHSPWMNLCGGEIRELKRGLTRKMLKQNVPKKLWDHCLELESRIRLQPSTKIGRASCRAC